MLELTTIIEVDYEEKEVLIHFKNVSSKYDEWVWIGSIRLELLKNSKNILVTEKFSVVESCLAAWRESRKFLAPMKTVMKNDPYKLLFYDVFVKVFKVLK